MSTRIAKVRDSSEQELLALLQQQVWVEDYGAGETELLSLATLLTLPDKLKNDADAMRQRHVMDGSEERRISQLVREAKRFDRTLNAALNHDGVQLWIGETATAALSKSIKRLVHDGETAAAELRKGRRRRGAPQKLLQTYVLRELGSRIVAILGTAPEPLLSWDKRAAEAARITKEIAALVGIAVSRKTIQNLLSRSR